MFIRVSRKPYCGNKKVYGVGINDADYSVYYREGGKVYRCPYYRKWTGMLERCYSEKYHAKEPTYKDCTVCDEWLYFSNFREWMESQNWEGKQLDKDILYYGNKEYSPDKCIFVTQEINCLLTNTYQSKTDLPVGVHLDKDNITNPYASQISVNGQKLHLGYYKTAEEAHKKYMGAKALNLMLISKEQNDIRLKEGLIRCAWQMF